MDVLQDAGVAVDQDEQHPAVGAGIGPALPAPAPGQVQRRAVRHGEAAVIDHRLTRAGRGRTAATGSRPAGIAGRTAGERPAG